MANVDFTYQRFDLLAVLGRGVEAEEEPQVGAMVVTRPPCFFEVLQEPLCHVTAEPQTMAQRIDGQSLVGSASAAVTTAIAPLAHPTRG